MVLWVVLDLSATSWAYDVGAWIEPKPAAMGWWQVGICSSCAADFVM